MSSLQHRLAAVTDTITNLIAQLRELDRVRERVRKAEISARKSLPPKRRKRVLAEIGHSQFENAEQSPWAPGGMKSTGAINSALIGRHRSAMMDNLIILRCPQTGMDVQTLLYKQEHEDARPYYVAVTCTACTRLHFIDKSTGKALGQDK